MDTSTWILRLGLSRGRCVFIVKCTSPSTSAVVHGHRHRPPPERPRLPTLNLLPLNTNCSGQHPPYFLSLNVTILGTF
jgi:hypothetical protein